MEETAFMASVEEFSDAAVTGGLLRAFVVAGKSVSVGSIGGVEELVLQAGEDRAGCRGNKTAFSMRTTILKEL